MLKDRVVLVTGAGRGIGRGIAKAVANKGAAVIVTDLAVDAANETADILREQVGHPKVLSLVHCNLDF